MKAQVLRSSPRAVLGESPVWDERHDTLYWVDIISGKVMSYDLSSERFDTILQTNDFVTCVALTDNPNYLIATLRNKVVLIDINKKVILKTLAEVNEPVNNRLNDCKVDVAGRLWFGSMDLNEKEPTGSLYVLEPSGIIRMVLSGVTISNGIDWSLDGKYMYYIDSPTKKIMVFKYDINKGEVLSKLFEIDLSNYNGIPDGMTVDSQGYLWVAIYGAGKVLRIEPSNGSVVDEVIVSVPFTTSCAFGGKDLTTLYITTARNFPREEERNTDDGKMHFIHTIVKGNLSKKFKLMF